MIAILAIIIIVTLTVFFEWLAEYCRTGKKPTGFIDKGITPLDREWWD